MARPTNKGTGNNSTPVTGIKHWGIMNRATCFRDIGNMGASNSTSNESTLVAGVTVTEVPITEALVSGAPVTGVSATRVVLLTGVPVSNAHQ